MVRSKLLHHSWRLSISASISLCLALRSNNCLRRINSCQMRPARHTPYYPKARSRVFPHGGKSPSPFSSLPFPWAVERGARHQCAYGQRWPSSDLAFHQSSSDLKVCCTWPMSTSTGAMLCRLCVPLWACYAAWSRSHALEEVVCPFATRLHQL